MTEQITSPKGMRDVVIVMGVSGTGKTTLATALAEAYKVRYVEADDYHPQANIDKMAGGTPLTDADRWPWLHALRDEIELALAQHQPLVVTCSALKQRYRDVLKRDGEPICFVFLDGDFETIYARMQQRDHFMPAEMLQSQFEALEPPTDALRLPITLTTEVQRALVDRHLTRTIA
ncbi:MAG: gluconokinase [Bacteroidota bacterium]